MTIDEALGMIKAHNQCVKLEREKHCSSECDGCDIGYAQGHVGEVNEMFEELSEWLEELKTYRECNIFEYNKAIDDFAGMLLCEMDNMNIQKTVIRVMKYLKRSD